MAHFRASHFHACRDARRLVQMGTLSSRWVTSHWRFRAPSTSFSTSSGLAKKSTSRVRKAVLQLYSGLAIDAESSEHPEKHSSPDKDRLNKEQRTIFDLVIEQKESVFFTGPAGTGKSVLLKKIIRSLATKDVRGGERVAVTASTGLAAHNIGGMTLHRFAGIGLGQAPIEKLIQDILKNKSKLQRWSDVDVLIIDEVSMIDSALFDKLDEIARKVRKIDLPFGGIQLVITGDFFQLPPVRKGSDDGSPKFCFESEIWNHAIQHTIGLTQIYRQRDAEFTIMLNQMREGRLSPSTIAKFRKLNRPVADDGVEATELFPLRHEADRANLRRLENINSKAYSYTAEDGGIIANENTRKMLLSDCIAPVSLTFKKGAQVILTQNIDEGLVNGSQGRIIGFANESSFLRNRSRWDDEHRELHDSVKQSQEFDELLGGRSPAYPVVRFSTQVHLCRPMEWAVERWVPNPWEKDCWVVEKLATRVQVPLLLAWALSIHKAQGQTLDRVKVDLNRVFETGHAYVAVSRATSMEGLQVSNFDSRKVTVHPKVKAFYASLSRGQRRRIT